MLKSLMFVLLIAATLGSKPVQNSPREGGTYLGDSNKQGGDLASLVADSGRRGEGGDYVSLVVADPGRQGGSYASLTLAGAPGVFKGENLGPEDMDACEGPQSEVASLYAVEDGRALYNTDPSSGPQSCEVMSLYADEGTKLYLRMHMTPPTCLVRLERIQVDNIRQGEFAGVMCIGRKLYNTDPSNAELVV